MIKAPVDDAGEGTFFKKIFRFHFPGLSFHAVAARSLKNVFHAGAIAGNTAIDTCLLERNPFLIIVHDHRQGSGAAFKNF